MWRHSRRRAYTGASLWMKGGGSVSVWTNAGSAPACAPSRYGCHTVTRILSGGGGVLVILVKADETCGRQAGKAWHNVIYAM